MEIVVRNNKYNVIKDYKEALENSNLEEIVTDYYDNFDYIVGDWAYGKLRLKGFYNKNHKFVKEHNNILNVDKYIENSCAYGCKYFILEKVKNNVVEKKG